MLPNPTAESAGCQSETTQFSLSYAVSIHFFHLTFCIYTVKKKHYLFGDSSNLSHIT